MATTALQVLETVQALGYGTDTKASQLAMLNQVHRRILNARRWTFDLASTTKNTTAGTAAVAFDATLGATQRIDAVRCADASGADSGLEYIDPAILRQYLAEGPTVTGTPRFWTRRGQNIELYPIPDAVYTLTVDTALNAAVLAEGTAVAIPDSHIDILVYGTIMGITFRERDWDGHNYARQLYAELFTEMLAQYGMQQRQQSSHIESSGQNEVYDVEDAYVASIWLN